MITAALPNKEQATNDVATLLAGAASGVKPCAPDFSNWLAEANQTSFATNSPVASPMPDPSREKPTDIAYPRLTSGKDWMVKKAVDTDKTPSAKGSSGDGLVAPEPVVPGVPLPIALPPTPIVETKPANADVAFAAEGEASAEKVAQAVVDTRPDFGSRAFHDLAHNPVQEAQAWDPQRPRVLSTPDLTRDMHTAIGKDQRTNDPGPLLNEDKAQRPVQPAGQSSPIQDQTISDQTVSDQMFAEVTSNPANGIEVVGAIGENQATISDADRGEHASSVASQGDAVQSPTIETPSKPAPNAIGQHSDVSGQVPEAANAVLTPGTMPAQSSRRVFSTSADAVQSKAAGKEPKSLAPVTPSHGNGKRDKRIESEGDGNRQAAPDNSSESSHKLFGDQSNNVDGHTDPVETSTVHTSVTQPVGHTAVSGDRDGDNKAPSALQAGPSAHELIRQNVAGDVEHDASGFLPGMVLNNARLVERASLSELRVGIHTGEFGAVDIRTSMAKNQITAQISVERGELGNMLSAELPSLQHKLSEHRVEIADFVVQNHTAGNSQGSQQEPRDTHRAPDPSTYSQPEATWSPAAAAMQIESVNATTRLDIHV